MQIRPEALATQLKRRNFAVVWVHGDEALLQLESADLVRQHYRAAGIVERQVFSIERGFKTDEVAAHTQALSLFSDQLLVELRWPGKPIKEHGEWLADTAAKLPDTVRLLVTSARLDRNALETEWAQQLDAYCLFVPIYPVERVALGDWITQRLALQKQQIDPDTLAFVSERVEGNLLAAQQEIRKLALLFEPGKLPPEAVREAVLNVARYDTADLVEAMLSGDLARALRSLSGLQAESAAEPLVLWVLADAIRSLLRCALAVRSGVPVASALKQSRLFSPRDRPYLLAFRQLDADRWVSRARRSLRLAARADRIIKGVEYGDAWSALESVILSVATDQVPLPETNGAVKA